MREFTSTCGAKVKINQAPFPDALNLKNAVWKEAAKVGFNLNDAKGLSEIDVSAFIGTFLSIDSSEGVYAAIRPCLARCLYNGEKISVNTFEDAREDFYEVLIACVEENLSPLVRSLVSGFKKATFVKSLQKDSQKSK